jgi:hypothetical protein
MAERGSAMAWVGKMRLQCEYGKQIIGRIMLGYFMTGK